MSGFVAAGGDYGAAGLQTTARMQMWTWTRKSRWRVHSNEGQARRLQDRKSEHAAGGDSDDGGHVALVHKGTSAALNASRIIQVTRGRQRGIGGGKRRVLYKRHIPEFIRVREAGLWEAIAVNSYLWLAGQTFNQLSVGLIFSLLTGFRCNPTSRCARTGPLERWTVNPSQRGTRGSKRV
ncbi:hypothetical protein OG21DRAFT_1525146 [Imleria badia]|nr:hypothetical protein OG21DRAFT_1525146 [Imleria badia]